ncbi:MAG: 5'-nucleotidase C-terminal domain-containing protein, partial [Bradymonadaceae bacterium]
GDLHAAQPFRNQLVTLTLTGRQIHDLLERQWRGGAHPTILQVSKGFAYTWHPDREVGNRVDPKSITLHGEPIDLDADYRVTVNNFLAEGGDGFKILKNGKNAQFGPLDIDALKTYFANHSPVSPPSSTRIQRAD